LSVGYAFEFLKSLKIKECHKFLTFLFFVLSKKGSISAKWVVRIASRLEFFSNMPRLPLFPSDKIDLTGKMTEMETSYLKEYEAMIDMHMGAFMIVGSALKEIRDRKLYRNSHETFEFETYVQKRFDFTVRHAQRIMVAYDESEKMRPIGRVQREFHLREILRLPEKNRLEAWTEIIEKAGTPEDVKIADVKDIVKKYLGAEPEKGLEAGQDFFTLFGSFQKEVERAKKVTDKQAISS